MESVQGKEECLKSGPKDDGAIECSLYNRKESHRLHYACNWPYSYFTQEKGKGSKLLVNKGWGGRGGASAGLLADDPRQQLPWGYPHTTYYRVL